MDRKKKTCKICKKERYMFSKGRCNECANKEYAQKTRQNQLKKLKESPKKKPKVTERHNEAKSAERVAMEAFWNVQSDGEGKCYCKECLLQGLSENWACVGSEFNPYNVAHIISKGSNPAFRCDMRNFIILCAEHHNEFDGGKRSEMKIFAETEEIRMKLHNEDSKKI